MADNDYPEPYKGLFEIVEVETLSGDLAFLVDIAKIRDVCEEIEAMQNQRTFFFTRGEAWKISGMFLSTTRQI